MTTLNRYFPAAERYKAVLNLTLWASSTAAKADPDAAKQSDLPYFDPSKIAAFFKSGIPQHAILRGPFHASADGKLMTSSANNKRAILRAPPYSQRRRIELSPDSVLQYINPKDRNVHVCSR